MTEPGLFTLGVEEEFQIVDPKTRELKSHIQQIIEDGKMVMAEKSTPGPNEAPKASAAKPSSILLRARGS